MDYETYSGGGENPIGKTVFVQFDKILATGEIMSWELRSAQNIPYYTLWVNSMDTPTIPGRCLFDDLEDAIESFREDIEK